MSRNQMYVVVFVMPGQNEQPLNREQVGELKDLVSTFGALMAQQLHARGLARNGQGDEEGTVHGEEEPSDVDAVGDDDQVVSFLEDCYRLQ